ncbi:plant cysteine oxidase 2-like [Euphorbia lathyris]|uniref:plant cysteine oxidase 2-like n=1 Tax=Euphorbia lathyris TaxID=212925 RepID=UPI00331383D4
MGIETSGVNRKGQGNEFGELEKEKNPILNPLPSPKGNTNTRGKKGRRGPLKKRAVAPVQKLYDTCKDVFSSTGPGIVPSPDQIEKLRAVLDDIKPEDVGLNSEMAYFRSPPAGRTPLIKYLHLHECDKFSIGIFCFPPSGVIPLHNHPGMTVFSKLLFGKMHIKSYDWMVENPCDDSAATEDPSQVKQPEDLLSETKQPEGLQLETKQRDVQGPKTEQSEVEEPESKQADLQDQETEQPDAQEETEQPDAQEPEMEQPEDQQPEAKHPKLQETEVKQQPLVKQPPIRLAKVKIDSEFTAPCNPTILYPADGGNMHRFTAITACAVLDVLGPPYSDPDGRHCTYYCDFPFVRFSVDGVSVDEEEKERHAWLLEKGMRPDEFAIVGELYRGPKIVKS